MNRALNYFLILLSHVYCKMFPKIWFLYLQKYQGQCYRVIPTGKSITYLVFLRAFYVCSLLEFCKSTLEIFRCVGVGVDVQSVQREAQSQEEGITPPKKGNATGWLAPQGKQGQPCSNSEYTIRPLPSGNEGRQGNPTLKLEEENITGDGPISWKSRKWLEADRSS